MKKMETYLNVLHYCFYKAHYKSHLFIKRLNPFRLLFKIPVVKRKAEKEGVNLDEAVDQAFGDKNFGMSMMVAGGALWGGMTLFFFSLLLIINIPMMPRVYMIICVALSAVICYFFVFKNDKYLGYFDKYEKWSQAEKRKYGWLTVAFVIIIFLLFYLGLTT